jgi:DNA transposition AAA+ family ATPase
VSYKTIPALGIAPLRNVILARRLVDHLVNRSPNLPGMGVLYGPSGYGKTMAVASVASAYRAVYVACRSYFTKRSFLLSILEEMAVKPGRTVHEMVNQICEQLALSRKPLVIDEVDHIVARNLVELVRDIYEGSGAAILMVGEEQFPMKLKRWERVHNRVLNWQMAEPSDLDDARKLAKLYSPDVPIADDLISRIVEETRGVTRRICVNIETVRQEGKKAGAKVIDLKAWGARSFDTGEAPLRKIA